MTSYFNALCVLLPWPLGQLLRIFFFVLASGICSIPILKHTSYYLLPSPAYSVFLPDLMRHTAYYKDGADSGRFASGRSDRSVQLNRNSVEIYM